MEFGSCMGKIYKQKTANIGMTFNKRGQEGLTLGTLLLIVLGVVVLVVIIVGATGAFDFIFSKTDQIPGQALEVVAQSCIIAARANLVTDYCYTFREVSDTQYINCQDSRIQQSLGQQEVTPIVCAEDNTQLHLSWNAKTEVCLGFSQSKRNDVFFNGDAEDLCNKYVNSSGSRIQFSE